MQKPLRKFLLGLGFAFALAGAVGSLMWLALARPADFYLFKSLRSQASLVLWLDPPHPVQSSSTFAPEKLNVSVWFNPERVREALQHADVWIQEYSLLRELTEEAAESEGEGYVLPPSMLPEAEEEQADVFLEDSYDIALRQLIQDIWQSGFLVLGGSVHFKSPFWLKPVMGWLSSGVHSSVPTSFFDSYILSLGDREDGADLPSWFAEIPYAHLEVLHAEGLTVQESVFELGGEQLGSLHTQLCELGHLPEQWCELDEGIQNPLEVLLYATEDFKAQFKVYWQIRGDHLVWSNSSRCLSALLSHADLSSERCGHFSKSLAPPSLSPLEKRFFAGKKHKQNNFMEAGFFVDQSGLQTIWDKSLKLLEDNPTEGASWLTDLLQSSGGAGFIEEIRSRLLTQALLRPHWGARFVWTSPATGELTTVANLVQSPRSDERLEARWAESQFEFLYALSSAWVGVPSSPGQIAKIEPWQKNKSLWEAMVQYRLGWSEGE